MAIARDTTAANIKPLTPSLIARYTCGATVAAGEVVEMQADGFVDPADTTSTVSKNAGIALQGASSGEIIDVVVFGRVQCVTGGTPGATVHASDTAGEPAESAGTSAGILGWVETATVLFVNPVIPA